MWHRCEGFAPADPAYAVFVTNARQTVAMWKQRAGRSGDGVIVWDYHVFLLARAPNGVTWNVTDPDSWLESPIPAAEYLAASFPRPEDVPEQYRPLFRLVPAAEYRRTLCTDRSHMRRGEGWLEPPPDTPCIGTGTNLHTFTNSERPSPGKLLDLAALMAFSAGPR